MSTDRDVNRIVRSWLEEGRTALPDRVLDTVLDQLPATPQRRARWPVRRFRDMNIAGRSLGAIAAVAVVAVIAVLALPRSGSGPGVQPTASPSAAQSPTATPSPTITSTASPFVSLHGQGPLDPGRYGVTAGLPGVTVAVPAGWSTDTDWVVIGPHGNDAPDGMAIRFFQVDNLAKNPLSPSDGVIVPPLGPTVSDLVQAIATHPAWTATTPADITIDGHLGQRIEFMIPLDAKVPNGQFVLSLTQGGSPDIWGWAPGQTFDWYIVDVNGTRFVIDAFHHPGTSANDLAAQRTVVESVQFGA